MKPDKIAIEFLTTAGNYFIVKEEGGYVTLDPTGDFAPELLKRYNNYPALESQVKELREALAKTMNIICDHRGVFPAFRHFMEDEEIQSIEKLQRKLLNKQP